MILIVGNAERLSTAVMRNAGVLVCDIHIKSAGFAKFVKTTKKKPGPIWFEDIILGGGRLPIIRVSQNINYLSFKIADKE